MELDSKTLNEVKPNRAERRANASYQKRRARKYKQIGSELTETEKQYSDGVDFSIFNMVLERIPMQGYQDTMDVLRTFYRSLYPFMRKMVVDTTYLRGLVEDDRIRPILEGALTEEEREEFHQLLSTPSNPFTECKRILNKIREEALKRSKHSSIIKPNNKIITR